MATKRKDVNLGKGRDPKFPSAYAKYIQMYQSFLSKLGRKVIALDLGMIYGYAYLNGNCLSYGYHNAKPTKYSTQITAALTFSAHIERMAQEMGGVDAILFEEVHGTKGQYAMQINGMFIGAMMTTAHKLNCKVVKGFQVSAIKLYGTGNAVAKKPEMIRTANSRYGLDLNHKDDIDGNIADAVHLLSLGCEALFAMKPLGYYIKHRKHA